jgi:hypothetical protein
VRVAYLSSSYPAISQAFVVREVEALRALGVDVGTFTVRRSDPRSILAAADRRELATTEWLLPTTLRRLLSAHLRALRCGPRAYVETLLDAVRARRGGFRSGIWQLFYFGEAVLLLVACRRRGLRHIHVHFANPAADVAMLAAQLGERLDGARSWSWSFTLHGPSDFFNIEANRLALKGASARFVVCISHFARSQLMSQLDPSHWGKLHVVHCGVDPEAFRAS